MFGTIGSYLRKPFEYFGLLAAERGPEMTELEAKLLRRLEEFFQEKTQVYVERQGHVTQITNDSIELSHRWIYEVSRDRDTFSVGDYVAWKEYKTGCGIEIRDVILVNDKNNVVEKTIDGQKITKIDGPKCSTNGGLIFYLDKVGCTPGFRPIVSDLVDLVCTYIKNSEETAADAEECDPDPSCIQVKSISPCGDRVVYHGEITHWDPSTSSGVVKGEVIFHQDVCDELTPTRGASVVCHCVKGEYEGGYRWRAYKVETKNNRVQSSKRHFFNVTEPRFEVVLGGIKTVELVATNNRERRCVVESVKFSMNDRDMSINHGIKLPYHILPETTVSWPVEVRGDKLGRHDLKLTWQIAGLNRPIVTRIFYCTIQQCLGDRETNPKVRRRAPLIVPGQRMRTNPIYRKKPMKDYPVPERLREICADNSGVDLIDVQINLNREYKFLAECVLSPENYVDHMHTMMFIEEIAEEKRYERLATRGSLLRCRDYVTFSFPADSEYAKVVAGDRVRASKPWEMVEYEGLVHAINPTSMFLKFSDGFEFPSGAQFDLKFVMNRSTNRRRHQAIDLVHQNLGADWLLPNEHTVVDQDPEPHIKAWHNPNLNREQKSAIRNILAKKNLPYPYIIYGPPGTGKTVTVVEAILQMIDPQSDYRILVTAPTNSAVDTLGLRLLDFGKIDKTEMVRLSSYNAYSSGHIAAGLVDISVVPSLGDPAHDCPISREEDDTPILYLNDLQRFRIVIGTLSTISLLNCAGLREGFFTHIIIDEAGQCHEPDTLLPIALVKPNKTQLVLAGDPQQLGPTISSVIAKTYCFDQSFLDRLTKAYLYRKSTDAFRETHGYNPVLITKLVNNYRSLPKIVDVVGSVFYGGDLRPTISEEHGREAEILKRIVLHRLELKENMDSMVFINLNTLEEQVEGNMSWMNHGEVAQVFSVLNYLYEKKVSADDIGVITPYTLQKKKIYEYLDAVGAISPKVASVEEFQGQERDVIILSLVRNNLGISKKLSSFVTDPHRVNVAMSRARVLNIIIGNRNTLMVDQLWAKIISKCRVIDCVTARVNRDPPVTSFPDPD